LSAQLINKNALLQTVFFGDFAPFAPLFVIFCGHKKAKIVIANKGSKRGLGTTPPLKHGCNSQTIT